MVKIWSERGVNMLRLFYAIEFQDDIKEFLDDIQGPIKSHSIKGNFTYIDNFHLTLRYMGEVTENQEYNLRELLKETFQSFSKFTLTTKDLGSFQRGNTEIIWVGIEESSELMEVYNTLERNLNDKGFEREKRPYKPHITIGREVVLKERSLLNYQLPQKEIWVDRLTLMNSKRINGRLMYVPIERVELKQSIGGEQYEGT